LSAHPGFTQSHSHNLRSGRPHSRFISSSAETFSGEAMLELENVKKSYIEPNGHRLPILDVPQFQLNAGEQMVLLGPSGCGKTTLLHVIAGISRADEGKIRLDKVDLGSLSEAGRDRYRAAKLGYCFRPSIC